MSDISESDTDTVVMEETPAVAGPSKSPAPSTSNELTPAESIALMKAHFDAKFDELTNSFAHSKPKEKEKEKFKFSNKSNKLQSEFNDGLLDSVVALKDMVLKRGSRKRQLDCLMDLESRLHKRNKLIKIADTSVAGWGTVAQYEAERIGSDSEDERKIKAAEKKALDKMKDRRDRRTTGKRRDYTSKNSTRAAPYNKAKPTDVCLRCNKTGHWKRDCFVKLAEGKEKERYEKNFAFIKTPNVKGKVKEKLEFWEHGLNANSVVLDTIKQGHKLQFDKLPQSKKFKNNSSAFKNHNFVESEIANLLHSKRVLEVEKAPFVVNPLTVAENPDGSLRLILDLRYVNEHLVNEYVRYDDWRVFGEYLEKDAWCFKFDLKSGYHHFDIHADYYQYLGFSWVIDGIERFFVFTVLVFGLSSAARIFTKMLRPLSTYFRNLGIKIAFYLDDGAGAAKTELLAEQDSRVVLDTLNKAGLMVNYEKSVWDPVQRMTWLGITVDTITGIYSITDKRINKCISHLNSILMCPLVSARKLAKVVGCLVSMHFVFGDIVSLRTRAMNSVIASLPTWDTKVNIKNCTLTTNEIYFWLENITKLNSRDMYKIEPVYDYVVHSDASDNAVGVIVNDIKCHRNLNNKEKEQSSTARELMAVLHGLDNLKTLFHAKSILWNVDNYAATFIVRKGSSKQHLQDVAIRLHEICMADSILLNVQWIPREFNCTADLLSKYIDIDNWEVTDRVFESLNDMWGPFTIDRFANARNTKVARFNSRFFELGSLGVDAFQFDWGGENNYIVPPVSMISRAINKCVRDRARGMLITPLWKSADFWPLLKNGTDWAKFVLETRVFAFHKTVQDWGIQDLSWTKLGGPNTKILALKFQCC